MNRKQVIEKAALLVAQHYSHPDLSEWEPDDRDWLVQMITAVVDALLPQVTTPEELESLPIYTVLVRFSVPTVEWLPNPMGHPVVISGGHRRYLHSGSATTAEELLAGGPLTVVWSPS